jgi:NAD+-dependent protein deacetylase sirtuin 4
LNRTSPARRLAVAWRLVESANVLLVVGSSLTVFSGRRFVYRARGEGMPVGINNLGPTCADELAAVKAEARLGEVLQRIAEELTD